MFIKILIVALILCLGWGLLKLFLDFYLMKIILKDFKIPASTILNGSKLVSYLRIINLRYSLDQTQQTIYFILVGFLFTCGVLLVNNFYIQGLFVIGFLMWSILYYVNRYLRIGIEEEIVRSGELLKELIINDYGDKKGK